MANINNITRLLRLLVIIPALLFLFACADEEGKEGGALKGNTTTEAEMTAKHRECWQASLVGEIYDTTGRISMEMHEKISDGAMTFMMVAFAVWLSFKMLTHVSSFSEESPAEVWTDVLKKFFICFVCGLLASSSTGTLFLLNSVIFPIYNAFLELGSEIMNAAVTDADGNPTSLSWARNDLPILGQPSGTLEAAHYDSACVAGSLDAATSTGFPQSPKQMMECLICSINERLNFGYTLGWRILIAPGFMALLCGLIIMCVFTFVKLGFVFYVLDSVFRFAMMVLILPLLIMSYAFKPTKKWATTGFLTIINSGAYMMFVAVVMFMCLAATQQILLDNQDIFDGSDPDFAEFSVPFLILLLVAFLVVSSLGVAKEITDSLVGGSGDNKIQKRIGKMAAATGKFLLAKLTAGISNVVLMVSPRARRMKAGFDKYRGKLDELQGIDKDDNR